MDRIDLLKRAIEFEKLSEECYEVTFREDDKEFFSAIVDILCEMRIEKCDLCKNDSELTVQGINICSNCLEKFNDHLKAAEVVKVNG